MQSFASPILPIPHHTPTKITHHNSRHAPT